MVLLPAPLGPASRTTSGVGEATLTLSYLLDERFEHGVIRVLVELDIDARPHVVGQLRKLASAGDRHQQRLGLFVDSQFGDPDGIRDRLERAAEVEASDDNGSAARVSPKQRTTEGH